MADNFYAPFAVFFSVFFAPFLPRCSVFCLLDGKTTNQKKNMNFIIADTMIKVQSTLLLFSSVLGGAHACDGRIWCSYKINQIHAKSTYFFDVVVGMFFILCV